MSTLFSAVITSAVKNLGFESLNPMQLEMINVCRKARQVQLISPTGSGKSVAFLLPLLEKSDVREPGIRSLIITPSRELALQIEQVFKSMGSGLKVSTCYGGHKVKTELDNLTESPALLIGTPGRILYHLVRGNIILNTLSTLILDEYDKSLEFGFEREISAILGQIPSPCQLILVSATKSVSVPDFVRIQNPVVLDYSGSLEPDRLDIRLIRSNENDKLGLLLKLLAQKQDGLTLIFCNHREAVERISLLLKDNGIMHDIYHGGLEQSQRERALIKFRNESTPILVTTDLASRGLDVSGVTNIIHYQPAGSETAFIHRNGRTARMDKKGTAWILLSSTENIPDYVPEPRVESLLADVASKQQAPYFETLYFGAGRKDKISKADVVGLLIQKGGLRKEEIGLINILDFESYAAVPAAKISKLLALLSNERMKNKKIRIARSN